MKNVLLSLVLATLGLPTVSSAVPAQDSPFFMPPNCNTRVALSDFKERIGYPHSDVKAEPTSDGYFPWSLLMGFWIDPSRDLVISVGKTREIETNKPALEVKFYSLCSGEPKASGIKVLEMPKKRKKHPIMQTQLELPMMFLSQGPVNEVQTTLNLIESKTKRKSRLDVSIVEAEKTQTPAMDAFLARKF